MKTTAYQKQYADRFFRTVLVAVIILLCIYSSMAQVQTRLAGIKYKGFEASFGSRSFKVNSDISKIKDMQAGHEGGSLGIILGNDVIISRLKLGYFTSNNNTPHTQEIFESTFQLNVYPLGFMKNSLRIRPYLTAGVGLDKVKFFGYYLDKGNASTDAYEPLLGKISQLSFTGGAGIGYSLSRYSDFISVFAEMNTVLPLHSNASNASFSQTSLSQFTTLSVGVRFGLNSKNHSIR